MTSLPQIATAVQGERSSIVSYLRYWSQCNKEAFPEQALTADCLATNIEKGTHLIGPWNVGQIEQEAKDTVKGDGL